MTLETANIEVDEKQLVVFDLASETYGVDIGSVREIIRIQETTKVPRTPEFVEGVINLRGKVIPVIDLRKRFGFKKTEATKDTRIVVVDIGGNDIGVVVDAVTEVLRLSSASVEPPSGVITTADSDYLLGIAKLETRLIILLDLQRALAADALAASSLAQNGELEDDVSGSEAPVKVKAKAKSKGSTKAESIVEEEYEPELQAAD
ncbi:MAG: chemotaxis protein CheW [Chloroflexi bacterium]|nr:chemotaxis protein CheW [Chloroflexota bacterium]